MKVVKGQPILYIDSAKTSTIEGSATTVYAQGGRGNSKLVTWEGEKNLTFTVEDALLSPIGFHILSGAGLFDASDDQVAYVHTTMISTVDDAGKIALNFDGTEIVATNAPIFVMTYENGSMGEIVPIQAVASSESGLAVTEDQKDAFKGKQVFVDLYVKKTKAVTELQIDAENFGGYYYVEASTLFRRESDGVDLPAEIVFPKVKVQSNFTFTMASSGDPSTFTFTMDAMPGYTMFNKSKKVLCAIQVVEDAISTEQSEPVTLGSADAAYVGEEDSRPNS